ncbi:hypothetical protein HYH02_002775 [Chlamydomonas schloesseri]|uniref:Mediator of RNA polymerase II transcription subunit 11 n=1 Tax=Chlamydomonas schloesseri TaxID=2026947 RepID=A0A835WSA5_9CHLO|nr:hypothetical protein HYH02_002775 [Chlamydomonas schloesseri]|eukprot:KAG2452537.1 hypothetical protein HYH02_002775 [Chlamydomonas schloesseri]
MATISATPQATEDYKRLQQIEQKVISCIQIAAQVTEHFSRIGRTSELAGPVQQLCATYMTTIAEALQLVKDGAEASTAEHRLELHAYHALARAHINTEKLQVMRMHLQDMQAELEAAGVWDPAAGNSGSAAAAAAAGGTATDAGLAAALPVVGAAAGQTGPEAATGTQPGQAALTGLGQGGSEPVAMEE